MTPAYSYLRLSVTDACNLDCFYCRPSLRPRVLKNKERLTREELLFLADALCLRGIKHIRLTGGEPLLWKDLFWLAEELSAKKIPLLSLTTNGLSLSDFAKRLGASGVGRINISLDTLKRGRFKKLTGTDGLSRVLEGISAARAAGVFELKLNVLLFKGVNDDEILDFVAFGLTHSVDVRFIEYFATKSPCDRTPSGFVATSAVKETIEQQYGSLDFMGSDPQGGPAQYYRIKETADEGAGRIGFISSVTDFFCRACNRLRLTCDGKLFVCLHSDYHLDLESALRTRDDQRLAKLLDEAFANKKFYNKAMCARAFEMSSVGG
ncbi:MAG: GTP 3',8-cyclase MoaA [Candidatus Omnitrophota bacterium]